MSKNTNIVHLLPEKWRESVEFSDLSEGKKYRFEKGARSETLYGPDGKNHACQDINSIMGGDLSVENPGISFLPLAPGSQDILHRVKSDVSYVVSMLRGLNLTNRFQKSDLGKREVNSRDREIGVMHVHHQCNIETLQELLSKMGLRLSDISHLIMACRLPAVRNAIDARFKKMGVGEVIVGCDSSGEEKPMFVDKEKSQIMSIAQLVYGKNVVELDVTYPKPQGEGYAPGHALWVVEEK